MAPDLNLSWEREEGEEEEGEEEEEPGSIEKSSCIPEAPFALVAFQNDDDGEGMGRFNSIWVDESILAAQLIQICMKIEHAHLCILTFELWRMLRYALKLGKNTLMFKVKQNVKIP